MKIRLSPHASRQAERRGIPEEVVLSVASEPQQTIQLRPNREVRQSRSRFRGESEEYLVRVIVDRLPDEDRIVTVYRTSKILKYWRQS